MLFATFCWHNEDNYLYSINYSHFGDVKQWYGIPGDHAKQFEQIMKDFLLELFKDSPDLLHHMTTQIPPSLLFGNGVPGKFFTNLFSLPTSSLVIEMNSINVVYIARFSDLVFAF